MANERLTLAVIVPALNEEANLKAMLRSLRTQSEPAERVLVVDGGSRDRTAAVAGELGADVRIVPGGGRGGQIAAGVACVSEKIVVIAHADMRFPPDALARIRRRLAEDLACSGGCLGHCFDSPRLVYRLVEWLDRRRARRGRSYGDQAQFFRRDVLVGGFPDQPIMEDVELARRLRSAGHVAYLDVPVTVSPRRFERLGLVRTAWTNWRFRRAYERHGLTACGGIHARYYPG